MVCFMCPGSNIEHYVMRVEWFRGLESCVRDYVALLYMDSCPPLPTREKSEYI